MTLITLAFRSPVAFLLPIQDHRYRTYLQGALPIFDMHFFLAALSALSCAAALPQGTSTQHEICKTPEKETDTTGPIWDCTEGQKSCCTGDAYPAEKVAHWQIPGFWNLQNCFPCRYLFLCEKTTQLLEFWLLFFSVPLLFSPDASWSLIFASLTVGFYSYSFLRRNLL